MLKETEFYSVHSETTKKTGHVELSRWVTFFFVIDVILTKRGGGRAVTPSPTPPARRANNSSITTTWTIGRFSQPHITLQKEHNQETGRKEAKMQEHHFILTLKVTA
jgi:hypothetical protein